VSVRDADHQPIPDALVGVITSTDPDEAFDDDGACDSDNTDGDCELADDSSATEPEGNIDIEVDLPDAAGTLMVWAWTGEPGDKFDADETDFASMEIDASLPGVDTELTDDMKKHAMVLAFGDTITFTLQIVNEDDEPVADAGMGVKVKAELEDFTSAAGQTDGALRDDGETTQTVHKTDAAGRIEIPFSAEDPDDADTSNDVYRLILTIEDYTEDDAAPDVENKTSLAPDVAVDPVVVTVTWVDTKSVASTIALSQDAEYHEPDADGVSNRVSATLVDQYGDPIKSKKVGFFSSDTDTGEDVTGLSDELAAPNERTTSKSGVATKRYSRKGGRGTETIQAVYVLGECNDAVQADNNADPVVEACDEPLAEDVGEDLVVESDDGLKHYWATSAVSEADEDTDYTTTDAVILVADTDNNVVVVMDTGSESGPKWMSYKSGDRFTVNGDFTDLEGFEKALGGAGAGDAVTARIDDDEDEINSFDFESV
jgi:hypothetical protein